MRIPLHWLDSAPATETGTVLGVPFTRGSCAADSAAAWHVATGDGRALPTQCWPLAWWDDSSVKWLAVAAVVSPDDAGLALVPGAVGPPRPVTVNRPGIEVFWTVDTGVITADVADRGRNLMHAIRRGGRTVAGETHLVAVRERREVRGRASLSTREECLGIIESAAVEMDGPVLVRIRLSGRHRGVDSGERWLPFTVRLSFWAGLDRIAVQHTVTYDGRPDRDHCAGLGLRQHLPLDDGPHNHHARLVGPEGVWCQPGRPIPPAWRGQFLAGDEARAAQLAGRVVTAPPGLGLVPDWDEIELVQSHHDHFHVRQRCGPGRGWIDTASGQRAPGAAALTDPHGGVLVALSDAWRAAPTALSITGIAGSRGAITAWWWPPQAGPMELRSYSDRGNEGVYEAVDPDPEVSASAYGIARTSRCNLHVLPAAAPDAELRARGAEVQPQLVCAAARYRDCAVFGTWWGAPEATSAASPAVAACEATLASWLSWLHGQVEERGWYGFWHHGDVMHSYDRQRATWCYDVGGWAWNNDEFMPSLWLWHAFLRDGDARAFHLALAMTRHVGDVDSLHLGRWRGLGSRHGVQHWSCPCKEPRIGQAWVERYGYYLTADPRLGELIDEAATAVATPSANDPSPDPAAAPHWRHGPDLIIQIGAWWTQYERSRDPAWLHRVATALRSIAAHPDGLAHGGQRQSDPATGALDERGRPFPSGLSNPFGSPQTLMELVDHLVHPGIAAALRADGPATADAASLAELVEALLLRLARSHAISAAEHQALPPAERDRVQTRWVLTGLMAWAAQRTGDATLARHAWDILIREGVAHATQDRCGYTIAAMVTAPQPSPWCSTPVTGTSLRQQTVAQWALQLFACMHLAPEAAIDPHAAGPAQ